MHCHIGRHISAGLGAQFLESPSQIVMPDPTYFDQGCENWWNYARTAVYQKEDSGL